MSANTSEKQDILSLEKGEYEYSAFISYSHQDSRWADWLHKSLESYRIPKKFVGYQTSKGIVPKKLFPVFRDQAELPTSSSLSDEIRNGLRDSRHLVIICSPRSSVSQWVNEEIRHFKSLGREENIHCLIVDGKPNVSSGATAAENECFPEALRDHDRPVGALEDQKEPGAADVRPGKDGRRKSKLKLIAGLTGIEYSALNDRENARRLYRLFQISILGFLILAAFMGIIFSWISDKYTAQKETRHNHGLTLLEKAELLKSEKRHMAAFLTAGHAIGYDGIGFPFEHLSPFLEKDTKEYEMAHSMALRIGFPLNWESANCCGKPSLFNNFKMVYDRDVFIIWGITDIQVWNWKTGNVIGQYSYPNAIEEMVVGNDGHFAAILNEGIIEIMDIETGTIVADAAIKTESLSDFCLSPDNSTLAWISKTGKIFLVSPENDNPIKQYNLFESEGEKIIFSADGRHVIASGRDDSSGLEFLRVIDNGSGKMKAEIEEADVSITALAASLDGNLVACGFVDGTLRIYKYPSLKLVKEILTPEPSSRYDYGIRIPNDNSIYQLVFSPDSSMIAAKDEQQTLRLWDVETGRILINIASDGLFYSNSISFTPDSKMLIDSSLTGSSLRYFDLNSFDEIRHCPGHKNRVTNLLFSPDGGFIVSAAGESYGMLWDTTSGKGRIIPLWPSAEVEAMICCPDSRTLIFGGKSTLLVFYDTVTDQISVISEDHEDTASCLTLSPDGRFFAAGGWKKVITRAVENGHVLKKFAFPQGWVTQIAWNADGNLMAVYGKEYGGIIIMDSSSGEFITEKKVPTLYDLAFHPSIKNRLAYAGSGTGVSFWDMDTNDETSVAGKSDLVYDIHFSNDGTLLAFTDGSSVKIHDEVTGRLYAVLDDISPYSHYTSLSIGPNATSIATGDNHGRIRHWDLPKETYTKLFPEVNHAVKKLTLSPNGKKLAVAVSAGGIWDKTSTILIYDLQLSKIIKEIELLGEQYGTEMVFSPDGKVLVFKDEKPAPKMIFGEKIIRVWDIENNREKPPLELKGSSSLGTMEFDVIGGYLLVMRESNIEVWDVFSNDGPMLLNPILPDTYQVVFDPTGRYLSASNLEKAVIYDWVDKKVMEEFKDHYGIFWDSRRRLWLFKQEADKRWSMKTWSQDNGKLKNVSQTIADFLTACISYDRKIMAIAGRKELAFWDLENDVIKEIHKHNLGEIVDLDFSHDGDSLYVCSSSGSWIFSSKAFDPLPKNFFNRFEFNGVELNYVSQPDNLFGDWRAPPRSGQTLN